MLTPGRVDPGQKVKDARLKRIHRMDGSLCSCLAVLLFCIAGGDVEREPVGGWGLARLHLPAQKMSTSGVTVDLRSNESLVQMDMAIEAERG